MLRRSVCAHFAGRDRYASVHVYWGIAMYRLLVCAGLIATLFLSGAEAKGVRMVRIPLAPGFSFAVPQGFMACDAPTNRLLGNAEHPRVMGQICAGAQRSGLQLLLMSSDPSRPIMILAFYTTDYVLPDAFISDASPELKGLMDRFICKSWIATHNIAQRCDLRTGSLAGRPAIIGNVEASDAHGSETAQFYIASSNTGTTLLEVLAPASGRAYLGTYAAAVVNSVEADQQQPPPPPPELVTLTPAPGVTMSVPKGWVACNDAATNTLLGNAPDPDHIGPRACEDPSDRQKLLVFDPHRFHYSEIRISYLTDKIDADKFADLLTPDSLARAQQEECNIIAKPLVDKGGTILSCVESAGALAGHPAKIVTIVALEQTEPDQPAIQYQNTLTVVPYSQGTVEFQTITSIMLKPMTQPALDAMMNSVVIPQ